MGNIILGVGFWLLCALYATGTMFAYFRHGYCVTSARNDLAFALGWGLFGGPISAVVAFFFSGFNEYGWRLK